MKIQISEIQIENLFGLLKEHRLTDEEFKEKSKWFRDNSECLLKQYPKLKLNDVPLTASFVEIFTDRYGRQQEKRYIIENDGGMSINVPRGDSFTARFDTYYKWRCDGGNMVIERDQQRNELLSSSLYGSKKDKKKNIKQAKSMSDVENKKGYIIEKMQGEHVRELQRMLMKLDYDLGTTKDDGIFGEMTKKAVEKFQKDVGIKPKKSIYGVFGPITLEKLKEKLKEKGL